MLSETYLYCSRLRIEIFKLDFGLSRIELVWKFWIEELHWVLYFALCSFIECIRWPEPFWMLPMLTSLFILFWARKLLLINFLLPLYLLLETLCRLPSLVVDRFECELEALLFLRLSFWIEELAPKKLESLALKSL
jgi:hypothetical protein